MLVQFRRFICVGQVESVGWVGLGWVGEIVEIRFELDWSSSLGWVGKIVFFWLVGQFGLVRLGLSGLLGLFAWVALGWLD